jgi:gluconokinase
MIFVIMGVSGSGKTTVGEMLAGRLGCGFSDADGFHTQANKDKMARGIALDDDDRRPWLEALRAAIVARERAGESHVFACSALKKRYRQTLRDGDDNVVFVFLNGTAEVIASRLSSRRGHFFDPHLLSSQFETLEAPDEQEAMIMDVREPATAIIDKIISRLDAKDLPAGV